MADVVRRLMRSKIFGASLGGAAVIFVLGIVFWGGFNTFMEATNTLEFCITCHEMEDNVYQEYKQTIHYENRTGVRAICSDCHVPNPWVHKIVRKVQASGELWHKMLGTIGTPEKFEQRRPLLANREWARLKATDSRECRNCHSFSAMQPGMQRKRAGKQHEFAIAEGQTCIDCHKGIAHRKPNEDGTPLPTFAEWTEMQAKKAAAEEAARQAAEEARKAAEEAARQKAAAEAAAKAAAAPAAVPAGAAAGVVSGLDWAALPATEVTLLYPGQTSYEWVLQGSDHGGARAYKKGEKCFDCHEGEQADMGAKMASGEKAETTPIPGKPPAIKMTVKAAHDDANLYMRFEWPAGPHTPAPFVDGGKMDPENEVKLALMIDQGKVEDAERSGCWSTCHHDARSMPDAGDPAKAGEAAKLLDLAKGVTKYLPQTRTEIEIRGGEGIPRGGWDKLKPQGELDQLLADGVFLDLLRWKSSGESADGYVSAQRIAADGGEGVEFVGAREGDNWVVTMVRPLKSDAAGDVSFEPGKLYTMGFAIHDDHTDARFHHVSVDYSFGLDGDEARIKAAKVSGVTVGAAGGPAAAPSASPAPAAAPAGDLPALDWGKAKPAEVTLLYPGQTSYEWVLQGSDHGGARAYKKGEKCFDCHEGEQADMGAKMASGEKAETTPIPGKPPAIKMTVKALHDTENLYMQFRWAAGPHTPAPFVDGGKMDPENEVKLALMIDQGKVEDAERSGCWSTCHHDARSMPDAGDPAKAGEAAKLLDLAKGVTKYLPQTRTEIEIRGGEGIPRGGWDKLKPQGELDQLLADGVFLDLLRWKSGGGSEDGYVSAQRLVDGGEGLNFSGTREGEEWVVTMVRKLKTGGAGDVAIEAGGLYTVGFAIHDDHTDARFHHVSVDYRLGLDNDEAEINAVGVQ